jgi:hypothetical protein
MGIGLVDYMVKAQTDPDTLEVFPDFGVYEDEEQYYLGEYKKVGRPKSPHLKPFKLAQ